MADLDQPPSVPAKHLRQALVDIVPGRQTPIWGFDGQFPGPLIRARRGRRVVVRQTNALPEATTTHLHGGHVPPEMDGHPMDLIAPGGVKEYEYPNHQPAATLWYHDHAMGLTGPHVYKGLAGFYLLEDDEELALNLPAGDYDVPLVIQDRAFNADGSFRYSGGGMMQGGMMAMMSGVLGDTILVNGAVEPFHRVANRKYRFRLLNGSNARHYDLALASGQPLVAIAGEYLRVALPPPRARGSRHDEPVPGCLVK